MLKRPQNIELISVTLESDDADISTLASLVQFVKG